MWRGHPVSTDGPAHGPVSRPGWARCGSAPAVGAIQPSKVELQMVQKDAGEVVDEAMPAGERKAELLSSESGAGRVVSPVEKPRRRGRPRKVRESDGAAGYGGSGREGSTRASTPAQQAPRKERKSFSSFVKELFDAQTSSSKKQDDSPERDEVPTELIFKLTRRGYGWGRRSFRS